MKRSEMSGAQRWAIIGGAAVMMSIASGMRQSWGLFQPHMVRDLEITTADFSLALAMQNMVWGMLQPFIGALADRYGARPVAVGGVLMYALGLLVCLYARSATTLILGAGVCLGLALACTASNISLAVTSRAAEAAKRSVTLGTVAALGSLGLVAISPMAQSLIRSGGWELAMMAFLGLIAVMLPAAFMAGGADRIEPDAESGPRQTASEAAREALGHSGYMVMAIAFFVCGLQLVFLIVHLPNYLEICGVDPGVGASALMLIGLFNVAGCVLFGWLGGRYSKRVLLGGTYILRSLAITVYFTFPPTPASTLVFAAVMGTLWLGIAPLITGLIIHMFGLRFLATISGIAFFSHQLGSFLGAYGGGLIYSSIGSYDLAWKIAVGIGLAAGVFQMTMNTRPSKRVLHEQREQSGLATQAG